MSFAYRIASLTFHSPDAPVSVEGAQVVVLIGPNNCGKSQALRDIQQSIDDGAAGVVVTALQDVRDGTPDEVVAWIRTTASIQREGAREFALGVHARCALDNVHAAWSNRETGMRELTGLLMFRADPGGRLGLTGVSPSINLVTDHPRAPLQRLLTDHGAEAHLSEAVRHAFGVGVCLNRAGGSQLMLHLGRPRAEARLDNPEYLNEVITLPRVDTQGDGMKAFIGLILTLIATDYPIVLIDEPEAFLHPPQARELARQLAAPSSQQRFIATHSSDVLLGLLDRAPSLTVIRLRREGDFTSAAVLDHEHVKALWSDASLRYSNLFDGLFHAGVVVCEAEGDARLYGAALDDVREANNEPAADLLFTPCGGKQKLPTAIGALYPLNVPVSVIADIDVLRDDALLQRIVEALGGDWGPLAPDWAIVAAAVNEMPVRAPVIRDVRNAIDGVLGTDPTARLSEDQTRRVRTITKTSDGWRLLKDSGVPAVPAGNATAAVQRLLPALEAAGVFVVPVGTLEQWDRAIGKRGLAFVDAALSGNLHQQDQPLRDFVRRVDKHLTDRPEASG